MKTEDTGTGREGITWDKTLHDSEDTEYSDPEEQAPNTNMGANMENSKTNENGYRQLTNINPATARSIAIYDDITNCGDHDDNVAEVNNQDDKAWTLLEIRYG